MPDPEKWQLLKTQRVFDSPWLSVRKDMVRTADGIVIDDYYVVERIDFVMIAALTPEREVIFIHEYKHGAGDVIRQCPAGYLNVNEDPIDAARRELLEETGYRGDKIEPLGAYYVSTGMLTTRGHLFLCRDATRQFAEHERRLDPQENIAIELMSYSEALQRITDQALTVDMATISTLLRAEQVLRTP